jgi:protein-S-isoprenylcysteine O-methyltransferase Ste14
MQRGTGHSVRSGTENLSRGIAIRLAEILIEFAVFGAILFVAAGTIGWANGWAFLATSLLVVLANATYVLPRNPEIIVERGRRHEGTTSSDSLVVSVYTVFYLAVFVVAGMDAGRWHGATLATGWAVVGAALLMLATVPVAGAMAVNRNLEQTVRIQRDRGHTVATTGPYRFVRHPMYLAMLVQLPATALLLGSAWAFIPAAAAAIALVVRTALEGAPSSPGAVTRPGAASPYRPRGPRPQQDI